ncbi:MAG: restriction endonuclease subunit S [Pseudomonadota bacterium]
MDRVLLHEICRPKQWKTISASKLLPSGYPVYGANGKIGFYSEYTHEYPTLMITCRGATCGNVHISEPKSYINGNAMALDKLDHRRSDIRYLFYYLKHRGLGDVISGSAQPQITRQGLEKVFVPLPPLPEQRRIAAILDKADAIRRKRQRAIEKCEEFLRSVFLDMFGDPVTNPKGWEIQELEFVCQKITDGEHLNPKFLSKGIPMIMAGNVLATGVTFGDVKYVGPEDAIKFRRKCNPEFGDILMVSRGATIGRCTVVDTNKEFALMGSVILLKPSTSKSSSAYLASLLSHPYYQRCLYKTSSASAQQAIYLTHLKKLRLPVPNINQQAKFSRLRDQIVTHRSVHELFYSRSSDVFHALTHLAFRGELTSEAADNLFKEVVAG